MTQSPEAVVADISERPGSDLSREPNNSGSPHTGPIGDPVATVPYDLTKFFEVSVDMLCIADVDGFFRLVNSAFERTLGYGRQDLLGRPFFDLVHPEDLEPTVEEIKKLSNGLLTQAFENRYRCSDGQHKVLQWAFFPEPATGLLYAVARDVTDQKRIERKLHELAKTDDLTQLANRRAFDKRLAHEWRRAIRSSTPLTLALVDVDSFKAYNDTYGQPSGDDCLRQIAPVLQEHCRRAADFVARYGGEEFALVLPGLAPRDSEVHCEKIRRRVERLKLPHPSAENWDVVTVSIGIATCTPNQELQPPGLVQAADEALYEAKRLGRNRVVHRFRVRMATTASNS